MSSNSDPSTSTAIPDAAQTCADDSPSKSPSEESHAAVQAYCDAQIDEWGVVSSRMIASTIDDAPSSTAIGSALVTAHDGDGPAGWLDDYELSIWRDGQPTKWRVDRVAGDIDDTPDRPWRKADLLAALDAHVDVDDGLRKYAAEADGDRTCIKPTRTWMVAVLGAVCGHLGADPGVDLDKLTKQIATETICDVLDIDTPRTTNTWNMDVCEAAYDVLVRDVDPRGEHA